jgi:hypothetical protein
VGAPLAEGDARAVNEVLHGARHEDLACLRQCGNSGADVHGDATYVLIADLTLAGVQTTTQWSTASSTVSISPVRFSSVASRVRGSDNPVPILS